MCHCPTNDKPNSTAWLPVQDVRAGIHSSMDENGLMEMLLKSMRCSDRCCCLSSAQYLARKKKHHRKRQCLMLSYIKQKST